MNHKINSVKSAAYAITLIAIFSVIIALWQIVQFDNIHTYLVFCTMSIMYAIGGFSLIGDLNDIVCEDESEL